jgi:hypothetical protein
MPTRSVILKQGNSREAVAKTPGVFLLGDGNLGPAVNDTNDRLKAVGVPLAYLSFGLLEVISATAYPKAKPTIKVNAKRIIRDMLICQKKNLKLTTWVFCTMIIRRRTVMIRTIMVLVFIRLPPRIKQALRRLLLIELVSQSQAVWGWGFEMPNGLSKSYRLLRSW